MGICGSKEGTSRENGPVERCDVVDGPTREINSDVGKENTGTVDRNTNNNTQDNVRSKDKIEASGNDEKDVGLVSGGQFNPSTFANIELIDLDENQDYIRAIEQAYQRKPRKLTRKDLLADVYRMDFPRRGKAIVINNENFKDSPKRKGTNIDFTRICNRFQRLGFEVERHNDVTCNQIMSAFVNCANEDHSDADCFAGILLSHGGSNEIHGTDGVLKLDIIFDLFQASRCESLAGKPKLFFIQSCRGEKFDDGTNLNVADAQGENAQPEEEVELRIPNDADFLISFSTVDGFYSWRNAKNGTWYIQALVRVLDECGTLLEIQKLLTRVNKCVAFEFESKAPNFERDKQKRQSPSFISRLTKDLYFDPK